MIHPPHCGFPGRPLSLLERAPAWLKLGLSALLGLWLVGFSQPSVPVLGSLLGLLLHLLARVNPMETLRGSWPALPLFMAVGGIHAVSGQWLQGAFLAWRLLILLWIGNLLARCTSSLEMVRSLEALLGVLPIKRIGFTARDLAFMLILAIRFLPILQQELWAIRKAQKAKAFRPRTLSWKKRGAHLLLLAQLLLEGMFRRADQVTRALRARAYRPGCLSGSSGQEAR